MTRHLDCANLSVVTCSGYAHVSLTIVRNTNTTTNINNTTNTNTTTNTTRFEQRLFFFLCILLLVEPTREVHGCSRRS